MPELIRWALIAQFCGFLILHLTKNVPYSSLIGDLASAPVTVVLPGIALIAGIVGCIIGYGRWMLWGCLLGGIAAIVCIFSRCAEANWQFLHLLEQGAQFWVPILGILFAFGNRSSQAVITSVAIALTFLGHGIYALGIPVRPTEFIGLVQGCLPLDSGGTAIMLTVVGILDVLAVICLFIPRTRRAALTYMVIWGSLTALARPWANFETASSLLRWGPELLIRAPHFLIPLYLLGHTAGSSRGSSRSGRLDVSNL